MTVRLLHGDCREVLRTLPDASVHSVVTDPPYELGFMGKGWDSTGIAYDRAMWCEVLRVLKPGGHLLAFGGTRTYHRMVCAIEDAGFEIRDQIGWVYGSGFPKSLDVSKAIDKAAGVEGSFGAPKSAAHAGWIERGRMRGDDGHEGYMRPWMSDADAIDRNARQYVGGTDAAREWQGWGTALKPAWEPIVVARKPLAGTVAANVLMHGTGALNIDACRIAANIGDEPLRWEHGRSMGYHGAEDGGPCLALTQPLGRWPANIIHDGSDEVLAAFPAEAGGQDKRQGLTPGQRPGGFGDVGANKGSSTPNGRLYADTGSAARFFYTTKASASDRTEGLHTVTARGRNHHPTVKPTDLMRYLCRLVTPPGGTVLDPFMGAGSTLKAAELEGFDVVGIELDATYIEVARRRIGADAPLFCAVPDVEVMP